MAWNLAYILGEPCYPIYYWEICSSAWWRNTETCRWNKLQVPHTPWWWHLPLWFELNAHHQHIQFTVQQVVWRGEVPQRDSSCRTLHSNITFNNHYGPAWHRWVCGCFVCLSCWPIGGIIGKMAGLSSILVWQLQLKEPTVYCNNKAYGLYSLTVGFSKLHWTKKAHQSWSIHWLLQAGWYQPRFVGCSFTVLSWYMSRQSHVCSQSDWRGMLPGHSIHTHMEVGWTILC